VQRDTDLSEKLFLSGWRAYAEQPHDLPGTVGKRVGRIGRNVDSLPGVHDRLFAPESGFDLAFKDRERLLKIMAMGWRTASGWDVHVDQAIATGKLNIRPERPMRKDVKIFPCESFVMRSIVMS